jgi:hypothetical protein
MQLTFKMRGNSQAITLAELNDFETLVGYSLPQDYRQHMLTHNGGVVEQNEIDHVNYIAGDKGVSDFYPIKYGYDTLEEVYDDLHENIPGGYIAIGRTRGQGEIIMSLNNGPTYGNIKEWFPDGDIYDLSPSFMQLLNDMVESEE